jgi:hypothetical protein
MGLSRQDFLSQVLNLNMTKFGHVVGVALKARAVVNRATCGVSALRAFIANARSKALHAYPIIVKDSE